MWTHQNFLHLERAPEAYAVCGVPYQSGTTRSGRRLERGAFRCLEHVSGFIDVYERGV